MCGRVIRLIHMYTLLGVAGYGIVSKCVTCTLQPILWLPHYHSTYILHVNQNIMILCASMHSIMYRMYSGIRPM
jgi:hypothetical protein